MAPSARDWDAQTREVSAEAILYQAQAFLAALREINEATHSREACRIRDVLDLLIEHIRDRLWELSNRPSLRPDDDKQARQLGGIVRELYAYVRFLQASEARRSPPCIQAALSALIKRHFPVNPDHAVAIVRPQWKYNLAHRHLTGELREVVVPAVIDPQKKLGARTADELIEKLCQIRIAEIDSEIVALPKSGLAVRIAEARKKTWEDAPRHVAVLSFASLDTHDTLLVPLLAHEFGHLLDHASQAALAQGEFPAEDKHLPRSDSKLLRNASYVPFAKVESELAEAVGISQQQAESHYSTLTKRIATCRREILADLLAARLMGLSFFIAQAEFLKSLVAWPQKWITDGGYPGIAHRLKIILEEITREERDATETASGLSGYKLEAYLERHRTTSPDAGEIISNLAAWRKRIDQAEAEARPLLITSSQPPTSAAGQQAHIHRILDNFAVAAIDAAMPFLEETARSMVPSRDVPRLSDHFFERVDIMKCDLPPYIDRDSETLPFSEILSAAWAYQLLHGDALERNVPDCDGRFGRYQVHCRLTMKALELAARRSSCVTEGFVGQSLGTDGSNETPNERVAGVCSKPDIVGRMALPQGHPSRIGVVPRFGACVQGASLDLHLGNWFRISKRARVPAINLLDPAARRNCLLLSQEEVYVYDDQQLIMHPGDLVLGCTLEFLAIPADLTAFVEGKSQLGRMGLIVATASPVAPGFHGVVVLELVNAGMVPLELTPGMEVSQLVFQTVTKPVDVGDLYKSSSFCQIKP